MTVDATEADVRARREFLIQRFFGSGNLIRWCDNEFPSTSAGSDIPVFLRVWIQEFVVEGGIVLLPRRRAGDRPVEWYALAETDSDFRALRDDLLAFLGPTYSYFNGAVYRPDAHDAIDGLATQFSQGRVYHLRLASISMEGRVFRLIELMRMLWRRRPRRAVLSFSYQPVGRLLRNFEMALQVQDWDAADATLESLRAGGQLSSQNLSHLKILRFAATSQWPAILALPELDVLLAGRRPSAVTSAILNAVYETEFAQFERENDVAGAVDHFRQGVRDRFAPLLRSVGAQTEPHVLKLFMMMAVVTFDAQRRDTILELRPNDGPDRAYLGALAALVAPSPLPPINDPSLVAERAYDAGDFDSAFKLLLRCSRDVHIVQRLLQCAVEIGTLEAAATSIEAFNSICETDRERVLRPRLCRMAWEELTRLGDRDEANAGKAALGSDTARTAEGTRVLPQNWADWIERLNTDAAWTGAIDTARHGVVEWSAVEFCENAVLVDRFVKGLAAGRDDRATTLLRNAVPHLLKSFRSDQQPTLILKPIYWGLLEILALDTEIGTSDLQAAADLVSALLDVGLGSVARGDTSGRNEIQELAELIRAAWSSVAAPRHVSWMVDVLALLADAAVQDRANLDQLFSGFLSDCKRFYRRVTEAQWDVLAPLCEEFGYADTYASCRPRAPETDAAAVAAASAFDHALDGKTVSIYTLSPQIGTRARQVLERRFPRATFRVSADPDGSPRLRQWARESDIFVVNTWDALHAATTWIKSNRPERLPTLLPVRKSWSALVSVVYEYVTETAR